MRYYVNEGSSAYSPVVSQCDGEMHWFHGDALGSTVGLTDASGGQTDTFLYEAFGTSLGRTGATETPYQFVGADGYFNEPAVGLRENGPSWFGALGFVDDVWAVGDDWATSPAWLGLGELTQAYREYYITDPLARQFGDPCYDAHRCFDECLDSYTLTARMGALIPGLISALGAALLPFWIVDKAAIEPWLPYGRGGGSADQTALGRVFQQLARARNQEKVARFWHNVMTTYKRQLLWRYGVRGTIRGLQIATATYAGWEYGTVLQCWAQCW